MNWMQQTDAAGNGECNLKNIYRMYCALQALQCKVYCILTSTGTKFRSSPSLSIINAKMESLERDINPQNTEVNPIRVPKYFCSNAKLTNRAYDPYVKVRAITPKNTEDSANCKCSTLAACIAENAKADKDATSNVIVTPHNLEFKYFLHKSTIRPGSAAIGIEK